uniref:von Willebrand factor A domain-containing protein 2 n=1 Tax=Knipowitschia caucasica TaxID=637954 RepID=A0AAV2LGR2_KNICA
MKCSGALDLLFLLDGSYSVGKGGFERSKHFAVKLTEALDVRPDKVRVGLIQFGSIPRLEFSLNKYSSKQEVKKHMKRVSFRQYYRLPEGTLELAKISKVLMAMEQGRVTEFKGKSLDQIQIEPEGRAMHPMVVAVPLLNVGGSTQTGLALKYISRKGFQGGRNSSGVAQIGVLLSDGRSQGNVVQAAARLKEAGVVLFTVGLRYPSVLSWAVFRSLGLACLGSACLGSACRESACLGSVCRGSACLGSACRGSACLGSACRGSACRGSACLGSACLGSACRESACLGSACLGSACLGSACRESACLGSVCRGWSELHAVASEPIQSHVFFAEHFTDAINGLYTTLSTFSVCDATPSGCHVESFPCERKTLETVKTLQGKFMCWKGSKGFSVSTSLCPFYSYTKTYQRHPTVCHRTLCAAPAVALDCAVDLLFLLEGSSSLRLSDFLRLKSFLKRFLQTVMAQDTPSRVGLAVYGGDTTVEAQVGAFSGDVKGLLRAVDALQPVGGDTNTGHALRHVTRHGFVSAQAFADVGEDLPRVVVLLSATPSADDEVEASKYARDREIFLVGVGPESLKEKLNNITGNPQRTLTYSTPDWFNAKIPELKAKICSVDTQGCLGQAVDLVVALDASGGVGKDNFLSLRDFVSGLTVQFDINRDVAQVALVSYARRATTVFNLDVHDTGSSILKAVQEATYLGGVASTGAALLHIHSDVLTVAKGARPGVNKAVVVLTDGSSAEDAVVPAQRLRDNGVSLFVIGVGDVQRERLLPIAGSEEHMISVASYEDLKYSEDVLVQMVCTEVKKPVDLCRPNPCMNDGVCTAAPGGNYRCRCRGYEGPHCETKSSSRSLVRGDQPKPAGLRRSRQKKSNRELLQDFKQQRRQRRH